MARYLRIALILVLALTIVLSCTVMGTRLTDPETYEHTIEVLDKNRVTVLGLSAASAAASAAISALPEDICTPLAEEISEFTTWFLMILSVIYLEKYLLTIFGAIACYALIPAGCSALLINCFFPKRAFQSIAAKLLALGAVLLLVIPTSVWISDQINEIYSESIVITVESANAVSDNLIGEMSGENEENTTVIDEAKAILGDVSGSVAGVIDQFKNVLNRFVEATAVMIVTTCLIPILVILFFVWIVKTLFNIQIVLPAHMPKPKKPGRSRKEESGLMETE
jgi:hypothetical protein